MNIFILSNSPTLAAQDQCDKHVVKMVLESAQLLCTSISILSGIDTPYKKTHVNHPCTQWVMESRANFRWLVIHAVALCHEYDYRYGKIHKSEKVIHWCGNNTPHFDKQELTPFALAMPDKYKSDDAVESYRNYYKGEKTAIAKWNKNRAAPSWWNK